MLLKGLISSLLTVFLLCLSFPPMDMGFLAWIALIPWFVFVIIGEKYVYQFSLFVGVVFFLTGLFWLRHITMPAWILLSFYCSVYFLAFVFLTRLIILRLRWPFTIVGPCVWAAMEFLRSFILSGFPWFFIGHTQYRYLPVVQISDVVGVYGVTFIIVLVNACVVDLLVYGFLCNDKRLLFPFAFFKKSIEPSGDRKSGGSFAGQYCGYLHSYRRFTLFGLVCIIPVVLVMAVLLYGLIWLNNYKPLEGPRVCVVQGNIPQSLKFEPTEEDQIQILKKYADMSMRAKDKSIDLLVWPETMVPGLLNINPELTGRKIDVLSQLTAIQLARDLNSNLLLGGIAIVINGEEQIYYNSAYYYNREGIMIDRYDKIHLVPFGEFTPLKRYFPFLAHLVPYEIGLTHGYKRTLFQLDSLSTGKYTFGSSICYEDTIPSLIRKFKKDGVDFLLNITNDGWFHNSAELDQHLAIMVFRAIENRICVIRAANTGISSFVSPDGDIYSKLLDEGGRYKGVGGTLIDNIRMIEKSNTVYTEYGDWFPVLCIAIPIIAFPITLTRRLYT